MNQRVDTTSQPASRSKKIPQAAKADAAPKIATRTKKTNVTSAPTTAVTTANTSPISTDERSRLIAEAAYYLAEKRGFSAGNELEDWLVAEREVNAKYPA